MQLHQRWWIIARVAGRKSIGTQTKGLDNMNKEDAKRNEILSADCNCKEVKEC